MKFTKGEWWLLDGVTTYNCLQIREVKVSEDNTSVYLYGISTLKDERPLGGVMHEIYISSPLEDIIRLKLCHFRGGKNNIPAFDINDKKVPLKVTTSEGVTEILSGKTKLVISHLPCSFEYYYDDKKITAISKRFGATELSYITVNSTPYMRVKFDVAIGEKIYGLGERFTPFVKNGQNVEIWNEDGGTCSEQAYKNVPFYLSSKNYGVFVNDTGKVSYEVCSEGVNNCQASVPGEKIDFMVIGGKDRKSVLEKYTDLTGKPSLPPAWTYGLWLTSSFTTRYDEKTIMSFINGMEERGIPISVFHIDCFWMKENEWCGFEWDSETFPNPKELIGKIKAKGIKVCLWINPYLGQKSKTFDEAMEKGYLLKKANGDVWQWDLWQSGMGVIDFTNPEATEWYKQKLRELMDIGIDVFKTDFGERIPVDCVYYDGSDPERMHNYYTYLYNKAVFEVLSERYKDDAFVFARSATAGCQKFPVHWGGDSISSYESMYESLRGGLSLCLSGFGFWSHDIGGFEGTAPSDVFKRWLAFGLLSSHSRLHGSNSYRVPWLFGEEAVDVCRFFNNLKNSLFPYIYSSAVYTHNTGVPMMRAMVLECDEIGAEDCDRQYFLGDNLLVAPVFSKDGDVDVYLPKGVWTSLLTNEEVEGQGWRKENHNFFSLPLYVKENSIIPIKEDGKIVLKMYNVKDTSCTLYEDGICVSTITAKVKDGKVVVAINGKQDNLKIVMVNQQVLDVKGGQVKDGYVTPTANSIEIETK